MDDSKQIMEFLSEKLKTNDPNKIKLYLNGLDKNKLAELAAEYKLWQANNKKKLVKRNLHGAKLNYFKSLKNQCAEDEEVVYYKKGGSVSCGCKKKEDGGQVKKDCGGSAIAKFKAARMAFGGPAKKEDKKGRYITVSKEQAEKAKQLNKNNSKLPLDNAVPKEDIPSYDKNKTKKKTNIPAKLCGSKIKKHQYGSVIDLFKMKRLGGSLNGIPFNQIFSLFPKNDNNNSTTVNPEEFYNKKTIEKLRKTKVTKRPSIQYTPIYPDTLAQIIRPYIAPGEKRYVPRIAYALWGGVVEEMIPFYGSYKLGKEFVKNPSWGKAAKFGVSALGDLALLGGVTAGAGLAIKGAKAAKAATNIAKGASKANKILKAEQAKRYYNTSAKALDDSAILYGGSSAIKATKK